MTDAKMALLDLVEQEADADLVREMLAFAAERMMDLEIEGKTGVSAGIRSPAPAQRPRFGLPQACLA